MTDLADVLVVNDLARSSYFGKKTLWQRIADAAGCRIHDFQSTGTASYHELKEWCWRSLPPPRPRLVVQNATWAHPCLGGPEPYVAVLIDNWRRMWGVQAREQDPVLSGATRVVVNSEQLRSDYAEYDRPPGRIRRISIGVDPEVFYHVGRRAAQARPRVVFVGDGIPYKGWAYVLELARSRREYDWTFILKATRGPPYGDALGRVLVALDERRVADELRLQDVFVLGSVAEGGSVAALEAMASGLPVVTSACGDFYDWRPPSFFQCVPGEVDSFDAALAAAIRARGDLDPRGDLLAAGRYTTDVVDRQWVELLRETVGRV